jgi:hypothetical protein
MKLIRSLVLLLGAAGACVAPPLSTDTLPEIRYYMIADT